MIFTLKILCIDPIIQNLSLCIENKLVTAISFFHIIVLSKQRLKNLGTDHCANTRMSGLIIIFISPPLN